MTSLNLQVPVAFIIFNRPDTTERVFEIIRQAKPSKLLVIADGPRLDRLEEAENCAATRSIINRVDWECEVLTDYSDTNMGCNHRISSGLDWVFSQVNEAIILEDDCLPHPTFFSFCEQMLVRYRDDERIMMISGCNLLEEWKSAIQSYHFSCYGGIWGWACWRRAWKYYDINMTLWADPEIKNRVKDFLADSKQYKIRKKNLDDTYNNKVDSWAYRWGLARFIQSGISVVPSVNLVSNIGFGEGATHTQLSASVLANISTTPFEFPIKFNKFTAVDRDYDKEFMKRSMHKGSILARLKNKFKGW